MVYFLVVMCNVVLLLHVKRTVTETEGLFLSSSLFCEYHNTEFCLSFALQAREIWGIRKGHSACFHACPSDDSLGCSLLWLPLEILLSSLYDQTLDGHKHISLFLLQDSDVTLWIQQHHILFLYFAHHLMDFSAFLKYHHIHEEMEKKKNLSSNSFLCSLVLVIICYSIYISLDIERKRRNKQEIRNKTSPRMMSYLLYCSNSPPLP